VGPELEHPELLRWAKAIEDVGWAGLLLDGDFRLVWLSEEIFHLLGAPPEQELGFGKHALEAFANDRWLQIATPESQARFFTDIAPFILEHAREQGIHLPEILPAPLLQFIDQVRSVPLPPVVHASIDYIDPYSHGSSVYPVDMMFLGLRDEGGAMYGVLGLTFMGVRPYLVSLLARGNQPMYERMANLHDPGSREAAVLFCDLEDPTELSRSLSTSQYFSLIRALWTDIDSLVAANTGVIGKQAGDGANAFFLVDDLGSDSAAAAAAIRCARGIHERSMATFKDVLGDPCRMRVGIHWGSSLYIGQLVPGGRLDVTALGDPMYECSRIQDCATAHETLASKDVIERLSPSDASQLDIDPDGVRYRLLSEIKPDDPKVTNGAASLPVTTV
jgi:class 3 adenylate cyclase